jgi:hypothetical protein
LITTALNAAWPLACLSFILFSPHELSILEPLKRKRLPKQCSRCLHFLELNNLRHDTKIEIYEKKTMQKEFVDEIETFLLKDERRLV